MLETRGVEAPFSFPRYESRGFCVFKFVPRNLDQPYSHPKPHPPLTLAVEYLPSGKVVNSCLQLAEIFIAF